MPPHAYELFEDSRAVGRLEWRSRPRADAGWYVTLPPRPPDRLSVDPAIDQLARDIKSSDSDWELSAELSAILSTAMAIDAADRLLHPHAELPRRRFNRLSSGPYEIHVTDIEPNVLAHAVPELPLTAAVRRAHPHRRAARGRTHHGSAPDRAARRPGRRRSPR